MIVGGGTAGCIVAARLSEDPSVRVCLLEAGPSDVGDDAILILNRWMHLLDSGYDWDYPIEPQERGNSFLRHARAKVLGGCSSHNSCIAFWPPAEGLDEWAAMGATGWDAASTLPYVSQAGEQRRGGRSARPRRTRAAARCATGRPVRRGRARCGGAGRHPDGRLQPRGDRPPGSRLVPDQRERGRSPHVHLARLPAPDPGRDRTSTCGRAAGPARSCSTTLSWPRACATSARTSPAMTWCRRAARSS